MYTIYLIENAVNGMRYVGRSKSFHVRQTGWHNQRGKLGQAMRVHGRDVFTVRVLDTAGNQLEARDKEASYIQKFSANNPAHGYNSPGRSS